MASTIITKNSSTASAIPAVGDLTKGELAVNVTDKKIYTKDNSAAVVKLVGSLGNQEASAVAITGGSIAGITDLAVADGGTGASTASDARTNLGLGTIATQAASSVTITGGSVTGITDITVADGGTGASTAANARSNLGAAASGANSDITSLSGLTTALSVAQGGTGITSFGSGVATFLGTPSSANLLAAVTDETGTGALVFANSPTLVTPALGTPSALVGTNITGTASGLTAGNVTTNANLTGAVTSVGNATSLGSFTSSQLAGALTDETGSGSAVFATSPTLVTPILGTPTSATLTNATGLPIATGVSGLGTGVATFLATPSSANLRSALTDETGTGSAVFATSPTLVTPVLGAATGTSFQGIIGNVTPAAGSFTTLGASSTATLNTLASSGATLTGGTINGMTIGATTASTGAFTTLSATGNVTLGDASTDTLNVGNGGLVKDASGNVGIGTSTFGLSAANRGDLEIVGSSGAVVGVKGGSSQSYLFNDGTNLYLATSSAGSNLVFQPASGVERMRLDSTGNLGIGTSSPTQKLQVVGSSLVSNSMFVGGAANGAVVFINSDGSAQTGDVSTDNTNMYLAAYSNRPLVFKTGASGGTERMRLDSSGNLGLGVTPSAWGSDNSRRGFDISTYGGLTSTSLAMDLVANAYFNGTIWVAKTTGAGTKYVQTNGNHTWQIAGSVSAGSQPSYTAAMTLDASGNLGIGTTSPTVRVDAVGTYRLQLRTNDSVPELRAITADGTAFKELGINGLDLRFNTSSTERARIDSSGNLLVGTTSALTGFTAARVAIKAPSTVTTGLVAQSQGSGYEAGAFWNTDTTGNNIFLLFGTEATYTTRGSITYNRAGGLTTYNTTSDYRAKDISGPVVGSGALIDSTPVYMGKMKGATQERPMFIAHEVPAYAHTGEKDAVDADGKPVYQQMDASALIPVMWAEIQSLRQRLSAANL